MSSKRPAVPTSNPSGFGEHRQGDPDAPEVRNPRGHDGQPDPTSHRSAQTASIESGTPPPPPSGDTADPGEEAKFLADNFDIPEQKAVDLVAPKRAGNLRETVHKERQSSGSGDHPVPAGPDRPATTDADEERLKPVLRKPNNRSGAG